MYVCSGFTDQTAQGISTKLIKYVLFGDPISKAKGQGHRVKKVKFKLSLLYI